ncbi:hypothetical protein ACIQU4_19100 [Streptomyces sp. NPDC090741]
MIHTPKPDADIQPTSAPPPAELRRKGLTDQERAVASQVDGPTRCR